MTEHRKKMCHSFTRSIESKGKTVEKGSMRMYVKKVSTIRALHPCIHIQHVLLQHHVGFNDYSWEIPNLQICYRRIMQPDILLTARQKLCAQPKTLVIAQLSLNAFPPAYLFNGRNKVWDMGRDNVAGLGGIML